MKTPVHISMKHLADSQIKGAIQSLGSCFPDFQFSEEQDLDRIPILVIRHNKTLVGKTEYPMQTHAIISRYIQDGLKKGKTRKKLAKVWSLRRRRSRDLSLRSC